MAYRRIEVRKLAGGCGAEVSGVDMRRPLDDETVAEIRRAVVDNLCLLILGNEGISDEQQVRFCANFGPFGKDPFVEGEATHPNAIKVAKEADEGGKPTFGGNWHSDWSFLETPPSFTFLHARELPPYGGDTMFANQYLAYETLSDGLRSTLDGLRAVYWAKSYAKGAVFHDNANARSMRIVHDDSYMAEMVHPIVRVHPESGRRALFANVAYTLRFEGMTQRESEPLLNFLYEHSTRPEFTCRFVWKPGAMAMWDNRCLQHFAINDYGGHRREMRRTTLRGEKPIAVGEDRNVGRAA